jgi:hypothetical protein
MLLWPLMWTVPSGDGVLTPTFWAVSREVEINKEIRMTCNLFMKRGLVHCKLCPHAKLSNPY